MTDTKFCGYFLNALYIISDRTANLRLMNFTAWIAEKFGYYEDAMAMREQALVYRNLKELL